MRYPVARITTLLAAAVAVLSLAACSSGDGGGGEDIPDPVDLLQDDRVMGLQRVVERSDNLLVPGLHVGYAISIGGSEQAVTEPIFQAPRAADRRRVKPRTRMTPRDPSLPCAT